MNEERYAVARMAALYGAAKTAYPTTLIAGVLLVGMLWGAIDTAPLFAWIGALTVVTLLRIGMHAGYDRDPSRRPARDWELRFGIGALAAGLLWTVPPIALFPADDPLRQMAIVFVGGGSVIGAAGLYASSPLAFYAFCLPPTLAVAARLGLAYGASFPFISALMVVFAVAMIRIHREIHRHFVGSLRASADQEALLERVAQSESQLRDAIDSFPEGVAIFDRSDRLVACNDAFARLYGGGRGAAQLPGTAYREIAANAFEAEVVGPEWEGRRDAWIEARMARRRAGSGQPRQYRARDGRALLGRFVRSAGGGSVSLFTDVTELKDAQDAVGRLRAEEEELLDTLPVGVVFLADRRIIRCNRRLEEMLGWGRGELDGKSARVLYPDDASWEAAGRGYERLRTEARVEGEFALATRSGGRLRCRMSTRAPARGEPKGWTIAAISDISEKHAAARELRRSEAMYRNLVETSNDLIWSADAQARWTYLSPGAAQRIYGCLATDLLGQPVGRLLAPELRERDQAVFQRILEGEPVFSYETRHQRPDGQTVDLMLNAVPLRDAGGAVIGATGTARDISAEKAAAAAQFEAIEKLRMAVDAAELAYWEWDRASATLHFGRAPLGTDPAAPRISFEDWLRRVHEDDREACRAAALATQQRGEPFQMDFRIRLPSGDLRWMHSRGRAITGRDGGIERVIGVSQDITERKRQEEEARFLAYHDTLTGLPNRRLLDDRLRQAVFLAQRHDGRVGVMLVDLDSFKQVNDALGHRAGDAVLREAAHRIAGCVRKADTLARHGGDEFVVVVPGLLRESDCQVVAEKILRALEAPFRVDGREFAIGASIGISTFPADAGDGEGVLRNADVAMYRAKQLGRNNYRFYGR